MRARPHLLLAAVAVAVSLVAAPVAQAEELSPAELLDTYKPVLVLDRAEAFPPVAVDSFVADSQLESLQGEPLEMPAAGVPVNDAALRLNLGGCTPNGVFGSFACYAARADGATTIYGRHRVVAGTHVLQYWLFYEHNVWSLDYVRSDVMWQAHEGDWEAVTVLLSEELEPIEAAYSRHCSGVRRSWGAVPKTLDGRPLVYVAFGSHANYFGPGVHAIDTACYPADVRAFFAQYRITPLDFALPGRVIGDAELERVHDNAPRWVRFEGIWGETQFVRAPQIGTIPFGSSPEGPALHDVWVDPIETIGRYPVG